MRERSLGRAGPSVGVIGFGAWNLSGDYGPASDTESIRTLRAGLDLGFTLVDTADEYGASHNERLVGKAIRGRRDEVVLATKFGLRRGRDGDFTICGRPEYARVALERSLRR